MSRRLLSALALLWLVAILNACTVLPEQKPQRHFMLPEPTLPPSEQASLDTILRIATPQASSPLASSRIVVLTEQNELSIYAGARWSERAPILLRDHLIEAFRQDGRLHAVLSDDSPARSTITLLSQLNAFHSTYPAAGQASKGVPEVVIRLDVQLIEDGSRQLLASQRFESRLPSDSAQLEAVIAAFGQASNRLSSELLAWTILQLDSGTPRP